MINKEKGRKREKEYRIEIVDANADSANSRQ